MVPEVSAWSRFTMNSCPSLEISFTYMASGPSQLPYTRDPDSPIASSPDILLQISGGVENILVLQQGRRWHHLANGFELDGILPVGCCKERFPGVLCVGSAVELVPDVCYFFWPIFPEKIQRGSRDLRSASCSIFFVNSQIPIFFKPTRENHLRKKKFHHSTCGNKECMTSCLLKKKQGAPIYQPKQNENKQGPWVRNMFQNIHITYQIIHINTQMRKVAFDTWEYFERTSNQNNIR